MVIEKRIRKDYPTTGVLKLNLASHSSNSSSLIRKDYPTTGVLKLIKFRYINSAWHINQEGLPDYWGIETIYFIQLALLFVQPIRKDYPTTGVLKRIRSSFLAISISFYQEGLPDYWGIETEQYKNHCYYAYPKIRKDYPTTGVLKLGDLVGMGYLSPFQIRKDYPTTGVLKLASCPT